VTSHYVRRTCFGRAGEVSQSMLVSAGVPWKRSLFPQLSRKRPETRIPQLFPQVSRRSNRLCGELYGTGLQSRGAPTQWSGKSPKGTLLTPLLSTRCKGRERGRSRAESSEARLTLIYHSRISANVKRTLRGLRRCHVSDVRHFLLSH